MRVYPEQMQRNLNATHGVIFSQQVLLALSKAGATREAAYAMVQRNAMRAWETGEEFRACCWRIRMSARSSPPRKLKAASIWGIISATWMLYSDASDSTVAGC